MNKTKSNKKKSCRQVSALESENWMRHATSALFGPVSRCVRFFGAGWSPAPARVLRWLSGAFCDSSEDESRSGIKNRRQARRPVRSHLPAVRAVTGVFGAFQSGVKIEGVISLLRSSSLKAYSPKKKVGVMPRKGAHFEQERKICPLSHS